MTTTTPQPPRQEASHPTRAATEPDCTAGAASDPLCSLTHAPTLLVLDAERTDLALWRAGCLNAASVHAVHAPESGSVTVQAVVVGRAGDTRIRTTASSSSTEPRTGRRAGQHLLHAGKAPGLGRTA